MKLTLGRIYYSLLGILFILMLFMPKLHMGIKAILVIGAVILCVYMSKEHVRFTNGKILILIYLMLNIISVVIGIEKGYGRYAVRTATVDIIWPACFLFMMDFQFGSKQLVWMYKAIIKITFALCVLDTIFIFCKSEWSFKLMSCFNLYTPRAEISGNWFLRVDHLYFFAFLIPFIMAVYFNCDVEFLKKIRMSKGFINITFGLSVFILLVSRMGAIWLVGAFAFFVSLFKFHLFKRKRTLIFILVSSIFLATISISSYFNEGIVYQIFEEVSEKFNVSMSASKENDSIRINQAKAMLDSWVESPLLGQGKGYPISYYRAGEYVTRADNELQYLILLYQKGILGVFSFFALIIYAIHILKSKKDIKWFSKPFIMGLVSFMLANAFNPYFANLSFMWILFFPFLLESKKIDKKLYIQGELEE